METDAKRTRKRLMQWAVLAATGISVGCSKQNIDEAGNAISKALASAQAALGLAHSTPEASPAEDVSDRAQVQSAVESYMRAHAAAGCALSFLDWSDFMTSGPTSIVTLHYRVQQPARQDILASVRFTLQGGSVVKAEVFQPVSAPQSVENLTVVPFPLQPPRPAVPLPTLPPVVIDHFSGALFAAEHGERMTMHLTDAFSLSQLEDAKASARAQRKPIGFLLVWGQFFEHEDDTRNDGSLSALIHFYQVFHDQLVLVFVRHETEIDSVPRAVAEGFHGPDEGGYAPNMAVTDANVTELIVEIPYKHLDGNGRERIFAAGGRKIDEWLASHPDAIATANVAGHPE